MQENNKWNKCGQVHAEGVVVIKSAAGVLEGLVPVFTDSAGLSENKLKELETNWWL